MIDQTDPVIAATLAYDVAQKAYDRAKVSGRPLHPRARRALAMNLALARHQLNEAVYEFDQIQNTSERLAHMLPLQGEGDAR